MTQTRIQTPGPLLAPDGTLSAVGWSPHPLLDCNLEQVRFYPLPLRPLQFLRVKRWDYYAVFTPRRFFSATIAERVARTNLGVIFSEVHQMFGRYQGRVVADDGEVISIQDLIGFAEEHRARW